ncbi:hypothetical protein [Streptomyces sporangiiformans]|uniref:SbtR family transcriptional regulator n=1 Tax=Streptomyces sporangiiformans TaxID=2315329 RepID=UPI003B8A8508
MAAYQVLDGVVRLGGQRLYAAFLGRFLETAAGDLAVKGAARAIGADTNADTDTAVKRTTTALAALIQAGKAEGDVHPDVTLADLYLLLDNAPTDRTTQASTRWLTHRSSSTWPTICPVPLKVEPVSTKSEWPVSLGAPRGGHECLQVDDQIASGSGGAPSHRQVPERQGLIPAASRAARPGRR